jgi:repressor LexA
MKDSINDTKKYFATNFKHYLDINNINRKKISEDLNIKYSTICEWLKGTMLPRADKLNQIADYFKVSPAKLLENSDEPILSYQYPFVTKIPSGYSFEQASAEFFSGWGVINYKHDIKEHFGIIVNHECNPSQPHYAIGEPVSFVITNKITEFDKDYVIRRDNHNAEIVRIYEDLDENKYLKYIMVPVYNEEKVYTPYYYDYDELGYEVLGIIDK